MRIHSFETFQMSAVNKSECLIDLSGDGSPTMMTFPPISADEMIVQPLGRLSISNNPFDTIEKQAKLFGDPFEITELSTLPRKGLNTLVPIGELIEVDGDSKTAKRGKCHSFNGMSSVPGNSPQFNNSLNPLDNAMYTTSASFATNSSFGDNSSSDAMNHAFLQSDSSIQANNSNRNRIHSDPVASKLSKIRKISGKPRSASLEQICLKNQLRKSLSNSPIGSPNWSKSNNPAVSLDNSVGNSLGPKQLNLSDLNRTSDSIFDDLLSTKPEWIDSDDDSDIERMTIPFLKNMQEMESTVESMSDCSDDRSVVMEKLSKFRKTSPETVPDVEKNVDVPETAPTVLEDKPSMDVNRPQIDNISSIIDTLRDAVSKCADDKKKGEASALLENLNLYLSNSSAIVSHSEPQPIVRQRTFSVDRRLSSSDETATPDKGATRELNTSLPVVSDVSSRKSITGTSPTAPRRYSRSMTYNGKPVSVVSAIQNATSSRERRSSVCTTPTRLVRTSSSSDPTSTRPSLSRKSLSLSSPSKDSKSVVKPVQRKTIMKTSNPLPSNAAAKPLKLRVGEQTKPIGPLRAVIPYKRTSSIGNNNEVSVKSKKPAQTSTPLTSNLLHKSTIPAASSTPVFTNDKPSSLSAYGHNRNRLSYTPSTPNVNVTVRQPVSEMKKKRVVSFSEETDKMSQSMIVGNSKLKERDFQPVTALQQRRLSRSYGTNKENSILQKK